MHIVTKGREVEVYNDNGARIRRISVNRTITNAVLNGSGDNATVSITKDDGHWEIYNMIGARIRQG